MERVIDNFARAAGVYHRLESELTSVMIAFTNYAFKICCYNLNGVRAAAKHGLEKYLEEEDADIVCFSEMKARKDQNPCNFKGYEVIWYECTERMGYAGTCILSKQKPINIVRGIGCEDEQGTFDL